jgi:hypothetical protein
MKKRRRPTFLEQMREVTAKSADPKVQALGFLNEVLHDILAKEIDEALESEGTANATNLEQRT